MGLLTGIIIYKAGKRRANKKRDKQERRESRARECEEFFEEDDCEDETWGEG